MERSCCFYHLSPLRLFFWQVLKYSGPQCFGRVCWPSHGRDGRAAWGHCCLESRLGLAHSQWPASLLSAWLPGPGQSCWPPPWGQGSLWPGGPFPAPPASIAAVPQLPASPGWRPGCPAPWGRKAKFKLGKNNSIEKENVPLIQIPSLPGPTGSVTHTASFPLHQANTQGDLLSGLASSLPRTIKQQLKSLLKVLSRNTWIEKFCLSKDFYLSTHFSYPYSNPSNTVYFGNGKQVLMNDK